jgi:hypothetical protein
MATQPAIMFPPRKSWQTQAARGDYHHIGPRFTTTLRNRQ